MDGMAALTALTVQNTQSVQVGCMQVDAWLCLGLQNVGHHVHV